MVNEEILREAIRERNTDKTISALVANGGRVKCSIPETKPSEIAVGKRFWRFNSQTWGWESIRITYIRSGVFFFALKGKRKEDMDFIHEFSAKRLYPESYESDLDPTYWESVCVCPMTKITYKKRD